MNFDAGKAEDVLPEVRRAGGSSGGARPKINVGFNPSTEAICPDTEILGDGFEHWLIKFPNQQDGPQAG
jgi:serine/threonine-protein kinase HipA